MNRKTEDANCKEQRFMPYRAFWNGRRVSLTGHTGFKGSWLSLWLEALGADVPGFALDPPTQPWSSWQSLLDAAERAHMPFCSGVCAKARPVLRSVVC